MNEICDERTQPNYKMRLASMIVRHDQYNKKYFPSRPEKKEMTEESGRNSIKSRRSKKSKHRRYSLDQIEWPATKQERFVSDDPSENKDNEDSRWKLFEILENDEERYKVVKDLWRNPNIPDPNENLTYYGFYVRQLLAQPLSKGKNIVGAGSWDQETTYEPEVQDVGSLELKADCSDEDDLGNISPHEEGEISEPSSPEVHDRKRSGCHLTPRSDSRPKKMRKFVGSGIYKMRMKSNEDKMLIEIYEMKKSVEEKRQRLLQEFGKILDGPGEERARAVVDRMKRLQTFRDLSQTTIRQKYHLKQNKIKQCGEEVDTVMQFYAGLKESSEGKKSVTLNEYQVNDLIATETLYEKMEEFYGKMDENGRN